MHVSVIGSTFLVLALLPAPATVSAEVVHDRAFWLDLRAQHFKLPQDEAVMPLALEATHLLGSPDPELRDAIGYEALETWVYRDRSLRDAELERLRKTLMVNARWGLGSGDGDGLFLRSFSTLVLSVFAAADLKQPFLDQSRFDAMVDLALEQLARERDLRGYIPGKGWGHATAHCADLLKFLGRSPRLQTAQQARIVSGIAERVRSAGTVFVWGEDARLALALAALARRPDLDPAPFEQWFARLGREHAAVWSDPFEVTRYVAVRAQLNALSELAADLEANSAGEGALAVRATLRKLRAATQ